MLDHGPVAGDAVDEQNAQRIEDRGPEAVEAARLDDRDEKDEIDDEKDDALEINGDDLARKCGHCEEKAAEEEDLHGDDREVQLREHGQMNRADAGVVGPGREAAGDFAKWQAGEDDQRDDERAAQRPPR